MRLSGLNQVLKQIPVFGECSFYGTDTYLLNCSAKMRLVEVPVMVMRPPMVAAYVMLRDRHLQIKWSLLVGYCESRRILGFFGGAGTLIEACLGTDGRNGFRNVRSRLCGGIVSLLMVSPRADIRSILYKTLDRNQALTSDHSTPRVWKTLLNKRPKLSTKSVFLSHIFLSSYIYNYLHVH